MNIQHGGFLLKKQIDLHKKVAFLHEYDIIIQKTQCAKCQKTF